MVHQVFISYADHDRVIADLICAALETRGIRCWMAHRDAAMGAAWSTSIVTAIEMTLAMVVLVSKDTCNSRHVPREVERADTKGKALLGFFLEDTEPSGALEYYFSAVQVLRGNPHLADDVERLSSAVSRVLGASSASDTTTVRNAGSPSTLDLIALGRSICAEVREELEIGISPEDRATIGELRHGQEIKFIDLACNKRARNTVLAWEARHKIPAQLVGEDLGERIASVHGRAVVCCLDSLDGTQHWIRGRDLYCTALSLFVKEDGADSPYKLMVSMVQNADGTIFVAREDLRKAFVDGRNTPLVAPSTSDSDLAKAHVCTVCRRPDHYRVLVPLLKNGSPFSGLYTFGGNPILAELGCGHYDAVFQPDASALRDTQPIWDWLPGLHIALRSGCCVLGLDGTEIDVLGEGEGALVNHLPGPSYVVSPSRELARSIVEWLGTASR